MFYNDSADAFHFKATNDTKLKVNLINNTALTIPQNAGSGKVLTSDANVNATWQSRKTTSSPITPAGCFSLDTATTSYKKIRNIGTFFKNSSTSFIDISYQSNIIVDYFSDTNVGVIFEIRIDSVATTLHGGNYVYKNRSIYENFNVYAVFQGLSAGSHTINLWAKTNTGTARRIKFDDGCWNSAGVNNIIVKEYE